MFVASLPEINVGNYLRNISQAERQRDYRVAGTTFSLLKKNTPPEYPSILWQLRPNLRETRRNIMVFNHGSERNQR